MNFWTEMIWFFLERENYIFVVCVDGYLQYAFYFLVVGAAIWASSWAGKIKTKKKIVFCLFLQLFLVIVIRIKDD